MKKITHSFIASVIAGCMLFSSFSWAGGSGDHQGPGWQHRGASDHHQTHRPQAAGRGYHEQHGNAYGHRRASRAHFTWNGYDFRRGRPAPAAFRGNHYRVDNWRDRGLRAPARGEHWASVNGNYVLIAAATGVITSIILNSAFNE
ncbi:RcnB family protein [[Erwinia] mediterraneensis]|uniref:RcnB family protein n=1 Tax=[Erwinia] mediterraneensis TaxID=2161819 RepID=UPI001031AE6B|nr:RcnB family protein [[Erwinia] mediterraneensis]